MNLPPKTIRQQIAKKDHGIAKAPHSAVKPITSDAIDQRIPAINPKPESLLVSQKKESFNPATENLVKAGSNAVQKPLESLPVLSAFQEFLDNERERTRKKILLMSLSYLLLLIIIVSVSFVAGIIMVGKLKDDFQNIRTEVSKLQTLSLKAKTDSETLSQRLSKETIRMRTEQDSSTEEVSGKLGKMDLLVQSLQKDNTILKDNLTSMQARLLGITNDLITSFSRIDNFRPKMQSPERTHQARSLPCLVMSITPKGLDHSVEWRIPIPE